MTEHFPRIFSISTVNFKQHYNCDYLIHKHRTDFSGDSGSGKSMIADILQLILAGYPTFQSSTSGTDNRTPQGMLLQRNQKRSTGYAFLNIEVTRKNFLIVGIFIDTSHNQVRPFIVQRGYDWLSELSLLSKPVSFKNFISDENVVELDVLKDSFPYGVLKSFSWKEYQKILFKNKLLSFDLTDSRNSQSYASILRAFSRGKGFKTDSSSLKDFIFGSDEKSAIWQKYQDDVKAIETEFSDHKRFIDESNKIREKQEHITKVVKAYQKYKELKSQYLSDKCAYCYNRQNRLTKELDKHRNTLKQENFEVAVLEFKELDLKKATLGELQCLYKKIENESYETIKENFLVASNNKKATECVKSWLEDNKLSLKGLIDSYQSQRQLQNNKDLLISFIEHLTTSNLLTEFETSEWLKDYDQQRRDYSSKLKQLQENLNYLKALSVFSDLKNKESLAAWALVNLTFPISIERESALIYFQTFPRHKPEGTRGERYLPFPDKLFDKFRVSNSDENGFWIDLSGVHEYIDNVKNPLLNINDSAEIKSKLQLFSSDVKTEATKLGMKISKAETLKNKLEEFSGLEEVITLYSQKDEVLAFEAEGYGKLSEIDFHTKIENFKNKKNVQDKYDIAEEAFKSLGGIEHKQKQLKGSFNLEENQFKKGQIDKTILSIDTECQNKVQVIDALNNDKSLNEKLLEEQFTIYTLPQRKAIAEQKVVITLQKIEVNEGLLKQATIDKEIAFSNFKNEYFREFDSFTSEGLEVHDPDKYDGGSSLKQDYESAKITFEQAYNFTKSFVEDDTLIDGYSVGELAHRLLPTVFPMSNINESLIDEGIAQRLDKLATNIKNIGSRKVDILASVIDRVLDVHNDYSDKVKSIDTYLKKHAITGGNKASLDYQTSTDFPPSWIDKIRKRLRNSAPDFGLFEGYEETVNINDMVINTFKQETGKARVDVEDLLNPKSYFDLSFSLELPKGRKNAGSNGQTYTANALLALAKISMIENEKSNGIQIMPIDEAEGLGSNYDLLHNLAKQEGYQIISMSIETAGDVNSGEQYIYTLSNNDGEPSSYVPPFGIFVEDELTENITNYYQQVIDDI